jgi:N-acetylmuramoyl-L-alanine amidase
MKLFLIAGHHDNDPGASTNHPILGKVSEASLTIELRDLIADYWIKTNIPVIRDYDGDILTVVLDKVNQNIKKEDFLIDIHFNAFNKKATGVEILTPNLSSKQSDRVAISMSKELSEIMGIPNRGIKKESDSARGRIAILRGIGNRILLEVCFIDNDSDLSSYWKNKHLVAECISRNIELWITE